MRIFYIMEFVFLPKRYLKIMPRAASINDDNLIFLGKNISKHFLNLQELHIKVHW